MIFQKKLPKVAVFLAAYNGERWLQSQINTILSQTGVKVDVFASLDRSSDGTRSILEELSKAFSNVYLLPYGATFGGAAKNFYRLIRDVDISSYDYVAFSDQDDIWLPNKLSRSLQAMRTSGSKCYSSDVLAFWPNGRQKLIKKSDRQRDYDFLFESAGPGCSYVFCVDAFVSFKDFVLSKWDEILKIESHDWLAYAFFRSRHYKWVIEAGPSMLYRQHENNQFGANATFSAYLYRLRLIKSGWYTREVRAISDVLGVKAPTKRFIFSNFRETRRRTVDSIAMIFFGLFF